jgi:outer membrane protein assembly factor BamB
MILSPRWRCDVLIIAVLLSSSVRAGDWPMWRYDAGRGAATPHALASELHLQWVRDLPAPQPAWPPSQLKLQFDAAPEPVVMAQRIFVPSTVDDSLTAYDTRTGGELWRFTADGPVRFAALAHNGRVYFVSDDGYLYCLGAENGELLWKLNGGPTRRTVLGNDRLISSWPARGAPVLHQGKIFFTASIWPFMGIFVHAVDPQSGRIIWTNSGDGMNYVPQPHRGAVGFATVAPQGYLAADGDHLIVPGGRSTPAVYDARNGKLLHFQFDKRYGGYYSSAAGGAYFVDGQIYSAADGKSLGTGQPAIIDGEMLLTARGGRVQVSTSEGVKESVAKDRRGKGTTSRQLSVRRLHQFEIADAHKIFLKAGPRVYTAGKGEIAAFEIGDDDSDVERKPAWSAKIEGDVFTMAAADERLFAVTTQGRMYCFGSETPRQVTEHRAVTLPIATRDDRFAELVRDILRHSAVSEGYALALSIGSGRLIEELLKHPGLHVIAIDSDADKVDRLRRTMRVPGLYGRRISAHVGDAATFEFPPYLANLIVSEGPVASGKPGAAWVQSVFSALRPYGGTLCIELSEREHAELEQQLKMQPPAKARLQRVGSLTLLHLEGPLPDTDDWTHQYGDASQSGISQEKRLKAPLGLLWFGGPSHEGILPRHGHGPSPQVAGGRLFIEGPDMLRATDVYTGRLLWERKLKGFGKYYDTTRHFPGAGEIGSNYVSLPDRIYAVYGQEILEIDAANGETTKTFRVPAEPGDDPPYFGYLGVDGELLVATVDPVDAPPSSSWLTTLKSITAAGAGAGTAPKKAANPPADPPLPSLDPPEKPSKKKAEAKAAESESPASETRPKTAAEKALGESTSTKVSSLDELETRYSATSRRLVVFNRDTGKLLWSREARFGFRHNTIAVAAGKIFCIDDLTEDRRKTLARRGIKLQGRGSLYALDARSGDVIWTSNQVSGTFLNYSQEHDVLLQAGSRYRDRAKDEADRGMIAFRGSDGKVLWQNNLSHGGPCLLWRDEVITNGSGGFSLKLKTGEATGWRYLRTYGCNTAIGCQNLLTFRSGAAGYYDLLHDSGTGNIGGFRSSCTNNLIPANGVLSAPDYTRTCTCAYQNQTSLALVHMPDAELWTFGGAFRDGRVGINFGAPGDRRSPTGTLWIEFPSVGGTSEQAPVEIEPKDVETFRLHSSLVSGELNWVAASGVVGARRIVLRVDESGEHDVKLHFLEPEATRLGGERIFDVAIQDEVVLDDLDIVKEAGGPRRALVKTFTATPKRGRIVIELNAKGDSPPIISGLELSGK